MKNCSSFFIQGKHQIIAPFSLFIIKQKKGSSDDDPLIRFITAGSVEDASQ